MWKRKIHERMALFNAVWKRHQRSGLHFCFSFSRFILFSLPSLLFPKIIVFLFSLSSSRSVSFQRITFSPTSRSSFFLILSLKVIFLISLQKVALPLQKFIFLPPKSHFIFSLSFSKKSQIMISLCSPHNMVFQSFCLFQSVSVQQELLLFSPSPFQKSPKVHFCFCNSLLLKFNFVFPT